MRRRNWESRDSEFCWFSSWLLVLFFFPGCARVCISDSGGVDVVGALGGRAKCHCCRHPASFILAVGPFCVVLVLVHLFCLVPACLQGEFWCFGPVSSTVHLNVSHFRVSALFEGVLCCG